MYTNRLRMLLGTEAAAAEPMAEALMTESHYVQIWHAKTTRRTGIARCMRLTMLRKEKLVRNRMSWLGLEVLAKKVKERYHVFMCIHYCIHIYIYLYIHKNYTYVFDFQKPRCFWVASLTPRGITLAGASDQPHRPRFAAGTPRSSKDRGRSFAVTRRSEQ